MTNILRQNQLYTYLLYCNGHGLEKKVLDCGAGGAQPPLALFAENGYQTYGIELKEKQIEKANNFADEHQLDLNITQGDLRQLPFEDDSFPYIYSYNTIFHMSKEEMAKAIQEIRRVLKTGGLCFVNFVSTNDIRCGKGKKVGEGEYLQEEHGEEVMHCFFETDEAEEYFDGFKIIYKEERIRHGFTRKGDKIRLGYIDYIIEKK